ncbi:hypothetical protein BG910_04830 [Neisseria chenwenguii]|uniref:Uncharacterized protein n=1 Tax=Neisseria chenwenguii TaxID=1853278 RepID=A0A220S166_9NEIS|nr:hypothetical protein BG910_04830 [Neisseria chenwenguii]
MRSSATVTADRYSVSKDFRPTILLRDSVAVGAAVWKSHWYQVETSKLNLLLYFSFNIEVNSADFTIYIKQERTAIDAAQRLYCLAQNQLIFRFGTTTASCVLME